MRTPRSRRPKWNHKNVPHYRWVEVARTDLRKEFGRDYKPAKCQMCGNVGLRYVHWMAHGTHAEILQVGRQCASEMVKPYASTGRHGNALNVEERSNYDAA